jgi:hypothetical protein
MNPGRDRRTGGRSWWRSNGVRGAILALAAVSLLLGTACDEEEAFRTFRSTASDSIQSGVNSIVDGLVDGLFAVFEQGTDESSTTTTTTG